MDKAKSYVCDERACYSVQTVGWTTAQCALQCELFTEQIRPA